MNNKFFHYTISNDLQSAKEKETIIVNTINPHSFITAEKDIEFKNALLESNILVPDGIGITIALKLFKKENIKRLTGWDVHQFYLNYANRNNLRVFYMGAAEHTLSKIRKKIAIHYPNVSVQTYSPPFKENFTNIENKIITNLINNFNTDILFIGMTAPKQEKWVYNNKKFISANIICSIGAVFDFFADPQKRANQFWIKTNLEWMQRLLNNPIKMYKRTFISVPKYILYIFLNRKCM